MKFQPLELEKIKQTGCDLRNLVNPFNPILSFDEKKGILLNEARTELIKLIEEITLENPNWLQYRDTFINFLSFSNGSINNEIKTKEDFEEICSEVKTLFVKVLNNLTKLLDDECESKSKGFIGGEHKLEN